MAGFDAFISYSRRASTTLATDLQVAVERFAKPFYRLRAVRVFRDDASMSANPALWSTIQSGLTEAGWFILLASPAAAQSEYVGHEVAWWRQHKPADRILIVLEEGVDIAWDRAANDFDFEVTDSLPRALSGAFSEEPRWIDLRWYEAPGSQGGDDPRWSQRVADIAAAVRGVDRDELIGDNVRQHKRAQLFLRSGITLISALLVASLVATYVALGQRAEANKQRDAATKQARVALARQLAAEAVSLAPTDLRAASLLAVQGYRTNADAQTRAALFQIATASPQLVRPMDVGAKVIASAVTPAGVVVTGDEAGMVKVWDGPQPTDVAQLPAPVTSVAVSDDARTVAAADSKEAVLWTGGKSTLLTDVAAASFVQVSGDGGLVAVTDNTRKTGVWSVHVGAASLVGTAPASGSDLAFGPAGLSLYGPQLARWFLLDSATAAVVAHGHHAVAMGATTAVSADGATFAAFSGRGSDVDVWRDEDAFSRDAEPNAVGHTTLATNEALAVSADGSLVATQAPGQLQVATVQGRDEAALRAKDLGGAGPMESGNSQALSFGGDRYLVSATGSTALLWDVTQFSRFGQALAVPVPQGCSACGAPKVVVSPDGSRAAVWSVGYLDVGPQVVDLSTGEASDLDPGLDNGYEAFAWAGNDQLLAHDSADSTLVSFQPATGPPSDVARVDLGGGLDEVVDISETNETARLVTRAGEVVTVDLTTRMSESDRTLAEDPRAQDAYIWELAPDGTQLAVVVAPAGENQQLLVLDLDTDELTFDGPAVGAAWDASSRLHVFNDSTVSLVEDGELVGTEPAPGVDPYPPPILSPDGTIVLTGGNVSDLRLLDLTHQGAVFGTIGVPQQNNLPPGSAFAPDGDTVVTALPPLETLNLPASVRTLSLNPEDWVKAACAMAARDLTKDDWSRYATGPAPEDLRCVQ